MGHPQTPVRPLPPRQSCLNVATASALAILLWKSKQAMNPLGLCLFPEKHIVRPTRLAKSNNISPPVPGIQWLPSNVMARIWNTVPEIQTAKTLGAAKSIVRKWANGLPH